MWRAKVETIIRLNDGTFETAMVEFQEVKNTDSALRISPMIGASDKLPAYLVAHGEISLTKNRRFQRKFV